MHPDFFSLKSQNSLNPIPEVVLLSLQAGLLTYKIILLPVVFPSANAESDMVTGFVPYYSGGTVPDSHRVLYYILKADT